MSAALNALAYDIAVSHPIRMPHAQLPAHTKRPPHHLNDTATKFTNPWDSFRLQSTSQWLSFVWDTLTEHPEVPSNVPSLIPTQKPTWGTEFGEGSIKATWLGHACYLVELPTPKGAARGPRIIFDPVFSHRCSPFASIGPARFTPPPCTMEEIPSVDAIVLSHNHYDHTDTATLKTLLKNYNPHVFAALGNHPYLSCLGFQDSHIHTMDWWEASEISLSLPSFDFLNVDRKPIPSEASTQPSSNESLIKITTKFKVTCTPCQHVSSRTPFDRWQTLWASWTVEEIFDEDQKLDYEVRTDNQDFQNRNGRKVYFAGDTGYRTVLPGEDEDKVPVCPAFKEIGDKIGPFDLALIPIGAYAPRGMWSNLHAHPKDSVDIFKDVKAKKALAMHWGTWILTTEPIMEPPEALREECKKASIPQELFDICGLGETRAF
ncbi:Metallo-hydrolase/oxidoreductase [Abortiporus biennis]|nr:Metallo-hydrolase/oxidoreductase [Abortiporus biennis]